MGSVVDFLQTFGELLKVKHICAVIIKIMKVKVNSINYYFLFFIFQVTFTNVFIEIEQAPCNKNVFHIAREFEHSLVFLKKISLFFRINDPKHLFPSVKFPNSKKCDFTAP